MKTLKQLDAKQKKDRDKLERALIKERLPFLEQLCKAKLKITADNHVQVIGQRESWSERLPFEFLNTPVNKLKPILDKYIKANKQTLLFGDRNEALFKDEEVMGLLNKARDLIESRYSIKLEYSGTNIVADKIPRDFYPKEPLSRVGFNSLSEFLYGLLETERNKA